MSGSRMPYVSELNEDGPQSRQTICKSPAVIEGRSHNCEGDPPSRLCILTKIRSSQQEAARRELIPTAKLSPKLEI